MDRATESTLEMYELDKCCNNSVQNRFVTGSQQFVTDSQQFHHHLINKIINSHDVSTH